MDHADQPVPVAAGARISLNGVDTEAIDSWLALLGAFMCGQATMPTPDFASGWLGAHRAHYGTAALAWLEQRRDR